MGFLKGHLKGQLRHSAHSSVQESALSMDHAKGLDQRPATALAPTSDGDPTSGGGGPQLQGPISAVTGPPDVSNDLPRPRTSPTLRVGNSDAQADLDVDLDVDMEAQIQAQAQAEAQAQAQAQTAAGVGTEGSGTQHFLTKVGGGMGMALDLSLSTTVSSSVAFGDLGASNLAPLPGGRTGGTGYTVDRSAYSGYDGYGERAEGGPAASIEPLKELPRPMDDYEQALRSLQTIQESLNQAASLYSELQRYQDFQLQQERRSVPASPSDASKRAGEGGVDGEREEGGSVSSASLEVSNLLQGFDVTWDRLSELSSTMHTMRQTQIQIQTQTQLPPSGHPTNPGLGPTSSASPSVSTSSLTGSITDFPSAHERGITSALSGSSVSVRGARGCGGNRSRNNPLRLSSSESRSLPPPMSRHLSSMGPSPLTTGPHMSSREVHAISPLLPSLRPCPVAFYLPWWYWWYWLLDILLC